MPVERPCTLCLLASVFVIDIFDDIQTGITVAYFIGDECILSIYSCNFDGAASYLFNQLPGDVMPRLLTPMS